MKELAKKIIGIDFGNTIFYKENEIKIVFPDALRVIRRMTSDSNMEVHIISKVDDEQEKRARQWISDTSFLQEVGLSMDHIHFCWERKDKADIARALNLTHHIDDRPEVMLHLSIGINKYLFRPIAEDVVKFFNDLRFHQIVILNTWVEIESLILN